MHFRKLRLGEKLTVYGDRVKGMHVFVTWRVDRLIFFRSRIERIGEISGTPNFHSIHV